jgi:hypothetical protein
MLAVMLTSAVHDCALPALLFVVAVVESTCTPSARSRDCVGRVRDNATHHSKNESFFCVFVCFDVFANVNYCVHCGHQKR